jgi:RNA polymerase sigma-70 factor (ECF subfamily)
LGSEQLLKDLPDNELVEMVRSGNQSAFKIIVQKYKTNVAGVVFGMLGNTLEAEDVGQNVFIRFYNSIEQYRGEAALSTYLTRIAINLSINEINRRKSKNLFSLEYWTQSAKEDTNENEHYSKFEQKEIVKKALLKLPDKYRLVIVLRLIEGYSTEETAEILEVPLGTVLSRLARAQEKLRKLLTPLMKEK